MRYNGAIHAELDKARQQAALADCLDGIGSPGRGPMEQDTLRGLSLLAWHIVTDIDGIQRELEGLADKPPRRSGRELKAALRKQAPEKSPDISGETVTK